MHESVRNVHLCTFADVKEYGVCACVRVCACSRFSGVACRKRHCLGFSLGTACVRFGSRPKVFFLDVLANLLLVLRSVFLQDSVLHVIDKNGTLRQVRIL